MKTNKSIFGYIGLGLLSLSYCFLISPYPNIFLILNMTSCFVLFHHAIEIRDKPFVLVNGFAAIVLFIKLMNGGIN